MRQSWWIIGLVWMLGGVSVAAQVLEPGSADSAGVLPWGVVITVVLFLGGGLVALVVARGRQKSQTGTPPPIEQVPPPLAGEPGYPVQDVPDRGGRIRDKTPPEELPKSDDDFVGSEEPVEPEPVVTEEEETIAFGDPAPPPPPQQQSHVDVDEAVPPPPASIPSIPSPPDLKTAQFTAYYPREAEVDRKHGLYVYASVPDDDDIAAEVEADISRFTAELGGDVPAPKAAKQTADLPTGTRITVTPESDELTFEPANLTKTWRGTWTQFGFDFYPTTEFADETCFVRVSVAVEGIEIAHIKAAIEVVPATAAPATFTPPVSPENPLLQQKLQAQTVTPYQNIFVSYSRRDTAVVKQYKLAQLALGNEVFVDVDNLRSGENWQAALARAIDNADIFQLFWSEHSAGSQYCRYEWEYALAQRCPDLVCEGFIRPVYWENPMPDVPDALGKLNFKYVPFIAAEAGTGPAPTPTQGGHTYVYNLRDVRGGNVIIGGEADMHGTQSSYHEGDLDDDA